MLLKTNLHKVILITCKSDKYSLRGRARLPFEIIQRQPAAPPPPSFAAYSGLAAMSRCADTAKLLEGPDTYKYLGITETRYSSVSRGMYSRIHEEIKRRVNMLLHAELSAKNLFRAVNQYALTVPNYYIGVVPMEPYQFARLDRMVRTQLYEKRAHKHCANISRPYLPHPHMIVVGKRKSRITVFEIGITSQHNVTSASR
ncbi:reverse transcriptase domain containing protein [Babesia caballi]|uniref:Reverse transcriptase domain containing protein n=1 Tax=Babesia caballi TaxID=5871 RepID=A0AAV4LPS2_BABCB|nr:reverse transcriptase domain containing protein [Babesia caballi]